MRNVREGAAEWAGPSCSPLGSGLAGVSGFHSFPKGLWVSEIGGQSPYFLSSMYSRNRCRGRNEKAVITFPLLRVRPAGMFLSYGPDTERRPSRPGLRESSPFPSVRGTRPGTMS